MQIDITDAQTQTSFFIIFLIVILLFTARRKKDEGIFGIRVTSEIKGFAVLAILFSHIGYFLVKDHTFLYPLSVMAGVGVNIFLFLSGFGLALSQQKEALSPVKFYLKRLGGLFIPLWLTLTIFLLMDRFILRISYPLDLTLKNYFGFYPIADLFTVVNSPLWYFTLILFYYLLFPLIFWRKYPYFSVLLLIAGGWFLFEQALPVHQDVLKLYKLHYLAFPLGILFALTHRYLEKYFSVIRYSAFLLIPLVGYFAIHSGVAEGIVQESRISYITMIAVILIFMFIHHTFGFLNIFGKYSYFIYLIHWPILVRYDVLYKTLPGALATIVYLGLFLILAIGLDKAAGYIEAKIIKKIVKE